MRVIDALHVRYQNYPYLGHETVKQDGLDVLMLWDDSVQATRAVVCAECDADLPRAEALAQDFDKRENTVGMVGYRDRVKEVS